MSSSNIVNALTVDVEDYFHVSAFARSIDRSDWDSMESRVERNTQRILQIFADASVSATFFTLGWVAERFPALVREITNNGHELACHGYSHQLIYRQDPKVFREETIRAKSLLEDISGLAVHGYRAASYSITHQSTWALATLIDAGFSYDSSIVPVRHDLYGLSGAKPYPYRVRVDSGREIVEFPPSTIAIGRGRIPIAGGGYFRLFPYGFSRWGMARINARDGQPFSFYLHPWEIDPDQPRVPAGWKSRFRHYNNLDKFEPRMLRLLDEFRFGTMTAVLDGLDLQLVELDTMVKSAREGMTA
jgi:polysaccharide deacetylase family protein (PEP-CTERM system associated)